MAGMKEKWDQRYREVSIASARPARVLEQFAYLLPESGTALDLACGTGGNALLLAARGLDTLAWDISETVVAKLQQHAVEHGLPLGAEVVDVEQSPPEPASLDVLVVSHFLYRPHLPALEQALAPGGLLFYQTFTRERTPDATGPGNPKFLLDPNELLRAFPNLRVLQYAEDGLQGDLKAGVRNLAMLVAQRASE